MSERRKFILRKDIYSNFSHRQLMFSETIQPLESKMFFLPNHSEITKYELAETISYNVLILFLILFFFYMRASFMPITLSNSRVEPRIFGFSPKISKIMTFGFNFFIHLKEH